MPGRETEKTWSTPVMRESTCSPGVATRFSTSLLEAPGKGTTTLAMVTSIWGSSSRGVTMTANNPRSSSTRASRGVMGDAWKVWAIRPEIPMSVSARMNRAICLSVS